MPVATMYIVTKSRRVNICKYCKLKLYYMTFPFLNLFSCYRSIILCESSIVWGRIVQIVKRPGGEMSLW